MPDTHLGREKRTGGDGERGHPAASARRLRSRGGEHSGNLAQLCADVSNCSGGSIQTLAGFGCGQGKARLRISTAMHLLKGLARAGKSVSLGMNQALDIQSQFHITTAVKPLSGATFVGLKLRKLRLPEAQYIGLNPADPSDIANLEIETVGDGWRFEGALPVELR